MLLTLLIQVEPTDVNSWTKVEYVNDGSAVDSYAAGVIISIFTSSGNHHPGISDVTMDACVPSPGNHRI